MKGVIIKLTEQQLKEAEESSFEYLANGDFKEYNGQSEVSVGGKKDNETNGTPKTSDDFADKLTSQTYNRYCGKAYKPHTIREQDSNDDGVDDFYNNSELDMLGNDMDNDDLVKIPQGIQYKADILVKAISPLSPKQQAIVLNKIIENLDLSSLPYSWLKELRLKINSRNSK